MNKVIVSGRLTADPDVRYSNSGDAIARYTLAVDRRFKKQMNKKKLIQKLIQQRFV